MLISPKSFLKSLVTSGVIDQSTADTYEVESLKNNQPIDQFLLEHSEIPHDVILKTKAQIMEVPYIDIAQAAVDPQALTHIPESVARRYSILPYQFNVKEDSILVATTDPLNLTLADFLEKKTGKKIIFSLTVSEDLEKAINLSYTQGLSPEVKEALKEVVPQELKTQTSIQSPTIREAPIAKIVNTILEFAVKSRASDIHIEPQETKTIVRYRIDGILQEKLSLPRTIHDSLLSRIKILSEMKIDEHRIPQDGRFEYKIGIKEIDLRVSTLPTVNGEKVEMRLLEKTGGLPSLTELGLRGTELKALEETITRPYGIILVTGPTGSGKTTTLYSILSRLNKPSLNIVTIEDPVEYHIGGINQVQINPQAGLTFATGLRAFLRQDPNIILVGEIRDKETTQLAIQAALTGHLVFSTLHTNNAATAIPRMIDLGGEPFLIATVLITSIAQRIVRKVCSFCKQTYDSPPEIEQDIKLMLGDLLPKVYRDGQKIKLTKGAGCDECGRTGYLGRIAIFEVLKITPAINRMILQESTAKEIETQARKEGMINMKQDGYLKALDGITTIEEILRVAES